MVKWKLATQNTTFKMCDVKDMTREALSGIARSNRLNVRTTCYRKKITGSEMACSLSNQELL
jgi:hypothetical protein